MVSSSLGIDRRARSAIAAIAFGCLLAAPGGAVAATGQGTLSPLLSALASPAIRSRPAPAQAAALGLPARGPGSLLRDGSRVLVDVRFDHGALARLPQLKQAGGRVVAASRRYQRVTLAVSPADLAPVARVPAVAAVLPVRAPIVRLEPCEGGSVVSEGVEQLKVLEAREEFPVDGAGVTVGVLSDSFDSAEEAVTGGEIETKAQDDVESKDLPGEDNSCPGQDEDVDVLEEFQPFPGEEAEPFDEGRAMLQIVHDVAPQASLAFASAFTGELKFAKNIENLAKAPTGADVIVDDVAYFEEPFFQNGPVANAVEKVAGDGVPYLSAAGNDNLFDGEGNEIASWEAPSFRDSGGCPTEISSLNGANGSHCLDFNPGAATDRTFGIKVEPEEVLSIDLQWAEPWNGVETDLDAFLLNASGELLTFAAEDNLGTTQEPVEILQWVNSSSSTRTVQLVVNDFAGEDPRLKFIFLQNGGGVSGIEYPRSGGGDVVGPSIFGHAAAPEAIAVGAIRFDSTTAPEEYSSRGPATLYFGPVAGSEPASPLAEAEVVPVPDVTATDCGATTFFAVEKAGVWRFCGTSAAAPHAAGVAALMAQEEPGASPEEISEAMAGTADPIGSFKSCAVGGGLLDAVGALEAISGEPFTPAEPCEPPDASGEVFIAPGDWGAENPPPTEPPPPPPPPPVSAPSTSFAKHPKKTVRIRGRSVRLVFRFRSDQAGVAFLCKVDKSAFRSCGAKLSRSFRPGRHVVRVKARNSAGLVDPTPAVFRFRVERI
jgi:subtilisin family serine protease